MKTRIITGFFIAAALLALSFLADVTVRVCVFALLAIVAQWEMVRALRAGGKNPMMWPGFAFALVMGAAAWFGTATFVWVLLILITAAVFCVRVFSKVLSTDDMLASLVPLLYPLPFFATIILAMLHPEPINSTILVMGIAYACATDVFAYFTGYLFGKHKLCPELSPKKTVEGAVGGFLGCALLGVLLYFIQSLWNASYPWWLYVTAAPFCSIAGQVGDLAASVLKREYGVKDYGFIFPGHGGVMDRFDSMLFALPMAYLAYKLMSIFTGMI